MPSKRLSFMSLEICFVFISRPSGLISLLKSYFLFLGLASGACTYKLSPRLLKHVRERSRAVTKYVTLVTLKLLHFTPYLRLLHIARPNASLTYTGFTFF